VSYDPNPATQSPRDRIRRIVSDTDTTDELWQDAEYDAALLDHDPSFFAAVSEAAYALAVKLDNKITSFGAQGKVDLGWTARATSLRAIGQQYAKLAADEAATSNDGPEIGKVVTVHMPYLTPDPYDCEVW
jgi:hypothetical protein